MNNRRKSKMKKENRIKNERKYEIKINMKNACKKKNE